MAEMAAGLVERVATAVVMAGKVDLAVGERAEDLGEGDSVVAAARAQHAGPKPRHSSNQGLAPDNN